MHASALLADLQTSLAGPGEVTPVEAWKALCEDARSVLVDVRTLPEWQFTGQPDMSAARGRLLSISWKIYPHMGLNPQFEAALRAEGVIPETRLFFLCRSGGRSHDAAEAMQRAGFAHCFNVLGGFEGESDDLRHRGTRTGWKASALPWRQS